MVNAFTIEAVSLFCLGGLGNAGCSSLLMGSWLAAENMVAVAFLIFINYLHSTFSPCLPLPCTSLSSYVSTIISTMLGVQCV